MMNLNTFFRKHGHEFSKMENFIKKFDKAVQDKKIIVDDRKYKRAKLTFLPMDFCASIKSGKLE